MKTQTTLRFARCLGIAATLALLSAIAAEFPNAQTPGQFDPLISLQERSQCLGAAGVRTARHLKTGTVRFVGTAAGQPIRQPRAVAADATAEVAARSYLSSCGSLFGLTDQANELTLMRSKPAGAGRSTVRFQQTHDGVPIIGAEMIVQLDSAKNIIAITGETVPKGLVSRRAMVDADAALQTAIVATAKTHAVDASALTATNPSLWYYVPALISPFNDAPALVWRMDVSSSDMRPIRELVLIDAERGGVALHFNQIHTARNRLTYTANGTSALPGTLVCDEANDACTGGTPDAMAAHRYARHTYDFYSTNHGRDSINGAGMPIVSTVHFRENPGIPYQNAFWTSALGQMVYGDGFPAADDVVGHELTHGVTSFESNLFYYYQSGAINESFSDLWGELMDQVNAAGTDTAGVKWLMGEDVPGFGAIRDMEDPTAFGDPDRIGSVNYYEGAADNGGVHFNSGVNNKAVFLMVDGGTFNGQTIVAMGATKVLKIYYEAQTNLLASGADYNDLHEILFQACGNLVGTGGITAGDCTNVRNATLAVEMHLQPAPNFHPEAPVCGAGESPNTLFSQNMEVNNGAFTFAAAAGSNRWGYVTGYAHGGLASLYGNDTPGTTTDTTATMTNQVMSLPANAFLHFSHAFGFEGPNFDGGVIEYSINNGGSWTDAGSLINAGQNYVGPLDPGNPLGPRNAFLSESHGYASTRLNLASLAGQNVKFRWRMGLDSTVAFFGWVVDDVRIYTCVAGGTRIINLSGSLAFGERHVGSSNTSTLTIGNSGSSALTVTSITYPAGFSGAFSGSVPAGGSQNVTVTFAPTAMQNYSGTVTVNANQTSGTPTTSASGVGSVDTTRDGDYDLDGKTDVTIYRPSEGRWYMLRSSTGFTPGPSYSFGVSTDVPVPGDYDGDGKTDIAIFRPSTGHWFILTSTSNFTTYVVYLFGMNTDQPVPGDYDNDNRTDIAIYRPSNGLWFILTSSSNFTVYSATSWGVPGDIPTPGDWDGDGDFDIAIYRGGYWFIRNIGTIQWGTTGDLLVPGDYNGDRAIDAAVYRPSTGQWIIRLTGSGSMVVHQWGVSTDLPVVGDFDADGKADITVFRNSGHWFVLRSGTGYTAFYTFQWGTSTDAILPRRPQ